MSTPEDLVRRKRVRAGHRSSATRMIGQLDLELATSSPDPNKISQLKRSLEEKIGTLKALDAEIPDLVDADETALTKEIERANDFKGTVYAAIIKAEGPLSSVSVSAATGGSPPVDAAAPPTVKNNRVRLPKLTLRPFSGDIIQWLTFWDSFESAIHSNDQLSEVVKFNYLKSLLNGTALEAIAGLTLSASNYMEAILILERRFGNRQQIIAKHMDQLLDVEPVTSAHNLKGLRYLFDFVETHIRSLKSLGVAADSYGSLLLSVLLNKLPPDIHLLISRKVPEREWSLDALLRELQDELQVRERVMVDKPSSGSASERKGQSSSHTAAALVAAGSTGAPTCCYCRQEHSAKDCKVVTQTEARKQILQKSGRCFVCLHPGHVSRDCRSRSRCSKCNRRHHMSICTGESRKTGGSPHQPQEAELSLRGAGTNNQASHAGQSQEAAPIGSGLNVAAPPFSSQNTASLYVTAGQSALLQTAQTTIRNPSQPTWGCGIQAILDLGSQHSYITQRVATTLSLEPEGVHKMSISTFGSSKTAVTTSELVRVVMETLDGDIELGLFTTPIICEPLTAQPIALCASSYEHLSGLRLADTSNGQSAVKVDILIGSDHYWELATGRVSRGEGSPIAMETKLGWVLSGPVPSSEVPLSLMTTHILKVDAQEDVTLNDTLCAFWELDSLGVSGSGQSVHQEFEQNLSFKDGHYEVCLPWKRPHPILPDNFELSRKRLQSTLRRLRQTPDILQEYDFVIQRQLELGIVQQVPDSDLGEVGLLHYLPHHAVVKQEKETTKVRVVYDASAKSGGSSLNECLFTGPNFNQKILDILLRFRSYPVALTADIEKAFLMVSVSKRDRDVLRFPWVKDIKEPDPDTQILRFTRVVFGVSSSPFLLNATIDHHLKLFSSTNPELIETLLRSIHVDDVVAGAVNEDAAMELYRKSKAVLCKGGFNLRKFTTNSPQLQRTIDAQETPALNFDPSGQGDLEETYAKATLGGVQTMGPTDQKVLGVKWNATADCFVFNVQEIASLADVEEPTKRKITRVVGRFYDPIGLLAPVVIKFKMFFQELCEKGLDWDQVLTEDTLHKWQLLVTSLKEVVSGGRNTSLAPTPAMISCTRAK